MLGGGSPRPLAGQPVATATPSAGQWCCSEHGLGSLWHHLLMAVPWGPAHLAEAGHLASSAGDPFFAGLSFTPLWMTRGTPDRTSEKLHELSCSRPDGSCPDPSLSLFPDPTLGESAPPRPDRLPLFHQHLAGSRCHRVSRGHLPSPLPTALTPSQKHASAKF